MTDFHPTTIKMSAITVRDDGMADVYILQESGGNAIFNVKGEILYVPNNVWVAIRLPVEDHEDPAT